MTRPLTKSVTGPFPALTGPELVGAMRIAARQSLYYLSESVLGRDKLVERIHGPWCRDVMRDDELFQLWLCPRGSYKTTLFTEALPLSLLLHDPDLRIHIVSSTATLAQGFVRAIRAHLRKGKLFEKLFGYWLGRQRQHGESNRGDELWVPARTRTAKEPSLSCSGMDNEITSVHYDVIIADDLVSRRDRESLAQREATKRYLKDLVSILEPGGRLIAVGTRWHHQDAYAEMIDSGQFAVRRYPVRDALGGLAMPEMYSEARLHDLREKIGSREFAAQYELSPLPAEGTLFSLEKMQFYRHENLRPEGWYIYADPSTGRTAHSDYGTIIVGCMSNGALHIDKCIIERMTPTRFPVAYWDAVDYCERQAGVVVRLGCESSGNQDHAVEAIRAMLQSKGRQDLISKLKWVDSKAYKSSRIEAIEGPVSSGQIRFRTDHETVYPRLVPTFCNWPQVEFDDPIDAAAGLWMISRGMGTEIQRRSVNIFTRTEGIRQL